MQKTQLLNFLLFQMGWFACVLGAAANLSYLGVIFAAFVIAFHLFTTEHRKQELLLIGIITLVGFSWDSLLVSIGAFQYDPQASSVIAPLWIAAMWAMFATTLNSSMAWMQHRRLLAGALGAIFGPLAYYSASKLGAVTILSSPDALILQSVAWAILMPAMLWLCIAIKQRALRTDLECIS